MAKKMTKQQLAALGSSARLKMDPEAREISGFQELINEIKTLIAQGSDRTQADLVRNQAQLEVLSTLQKMVRSNMTKSHSKPEALDLQPLQDILAQILEANARREALSYRFDIQRGEGGFMAGVTATPIPPTLK